MVPYDSAVRQIESGSAERVVTEADCAAREAALAQVAAELRRANQDLEQFAYIAAHDLQEPLRLMTSFMELFARRYGDVVDSTGQQYLHYALSGSRQMKALINDLLEYSRICNDLSSIAPVAMADVAHEVETTLQAALVDCDGELQIEPLPVVVGRRRQLKQLVYNLVRNALNYRAAERAPRIRLSATPVGTHWQFAVEDNGRGIAPEYHERVFMIFQRLTRDRAQPGTGMGLAICKKIVDTHRGRIWIESSATGGTRVLFTLPKPETSVDRLR